MKTEKQNLSDELKNELQASKDHLNSALPHVTTDSVTNKKYQVGFGLENGKPYIALKEVSQ